MRCLAGKIWGTFIQNARTAFHFAKMLARSFESGNTFARHHCQISPKGTMWIDRALNQIVNAELMLLSFHEHVPNFAVTSPL